MATDERVAQYLKKVAADLQRTRQRLNELESANTEPIAIVAMACRYPGGVSSPEQLWELLVDQRDPLGPFPADRGWDSSRLGPEVTRKGGFLDTAGDFDAGFFGISPREALAMDPQQRLLLETAWEALERAGIDPAALRGSDTGVFVGIADQHYGPRDAQAQEEVIGHLLTGTTNSVASGRLAYVLGTEGPALSVDTACSSSLVALHLAIRALRNGECSAALVGGAAVMSDPSLFVEFAEQQGLAADARCKSFAAAADGTGWGEGVAVLLVQRLSAARAAGNPVLAVVRGSAVNSDGASNGLTAPNGPSQQRLIRQALRDAGLSAGQVDVVEAHGTGTRLGDPVEAQALLATYGQDRDEPLLLGSIKSNIGHTQAAAGLAGVIKMVLALGRARLPATLHVDAPTPQVDWTAGKVELITQARDWPETGRPRRGAVSAFGISGTNAHVILEQAPTRPVPDAEPAPTAPTAPAPAVHRPVRALLLSARDTAALRAQGGLIEAYAQAHPDHDLASALATTRARLSHRAVVVGADDQTLLAGLRSLAAGEPDPAVVRGRARAHGKLAFLLSGQGSQRVGMAGGLRAAHPVFAEAFDEIATRFTALLPRPLATAVDDPELIDRTRYTQPALFAVEVALCRLLESWGIVPDVLLGHSIGELAAAHVAGVFSLDDACALVAARGRLMDDLPDGGAMAALEIAEADLPGLLAEAGHDAEIAAVNGPASLVVAGDVAAVEAIVAACAARGTRARRLPVSHAFHSARMEPMLERFREVAAGVTYSAPARTIVSARTGQPVTGAEIGTPDYWVEQVRHAVRFADGMRRLIADGCTGYLEVGPGGLTPMALENLAGSATPAAVAVALRRDQPEPESLLTALAELYVAGAPIPWERVVAVPGAPRLDLPTYPFQRERYWLTSGTETSHPVVLAAAPRQAGRPAHPLAGLAPEELSHRLLDRVRSATAAALGHRDRSAIDADQAFAELGMDSLSSVRMRDMLAQDTELVLPSTLVFDHPTPAAVVAYLRDELLGGAERVVVRRRAAVDDPVVIVGMACRFPGGVRDPEDLWRLVRDGTDAVGAFPTDRGWVTASLGDDIARRGGFLDAIADFDAGFFGISPREALGMDPQQRLLLETAWQALEHAGIDAADLRGSRTGVFAGVAGSDYAELLTGLAETESYVMTGSAASVVSGRLSYVLGLEGPSVTVDTACSSSLVALHLAVKALREGECDLALASGVTVMSTPAGISLVSQVGALAGDGRCKAFSDDADGTGWGEGVGVVVLQRRSEALRAGHRVLATVAGTAIGSDGASNGLTAPNGPAQQRVIRDALADAGLGPADVDLLEAHGTGTALGDPIEAQALMATYGTDRAEPLWLGSLKSNIGHTMAAAGIAGVIKAVLALRHATMPRTLHADPPSSKIDWSPGTLRLLTEQREWADPGRPRRAAVSAFGMSGTNAHVILAEADPADPAERPRESPDAGLVPLALSGRTADALRAQAARLAAYLVEHPDVRSEAVARALLRRTAFEHRAVVVGDDRDRLLDGVRAVAEGRTSDDVVSGVATAFDRGPVWVFPGYGAQWDGMAVELLDTAPVFAARWAECDAAFAPLLGWSITDVARGAAVPEDVPEVLVNQALLFSMMVSLAALWRSYGVTPAAVIGSSQGEVAAACVAGVLSPSDGATILVRRVWRAVALSNPGALASLAAPVADVESWLTRFAGAVEIGVVNSPRAVTVSGDQHAVEDLVAEAVGRGVRARLMPATYASHSAHMELLRDDVVADLAGVTPMPGTVPFFSTVTVDWAEPGQLDGEYWYRNMRQPVQLAPAVTALLGQGFTSFLEVSAHPLLVGPITETAEEAGVTAVATGSLRRQDGGPRRMLASLARLHVEGVRSDLGGAFTGGEPPVDDLPTYAFQRRRFWPAETDRPRGTGDPADDRFWQAVVDHDVDGVAATLGLADPAALDAVVPALADWRRNRHERAQLESWLYRVDWTPLPAAPGGRLVGTWLVLVSAGQDNGPAVDVVRDRADRTVVLEIPEPGPDTGADAAALAGLIRDAVGADALAGVLCLTGLDERPLTAYPDVTRGAAALLVTVRALHVAAETAPLWCATRGAVAVDPADGPAAPLQAIVWGLGRCVGLEHPRTWGGLIDLPVAWDADTAALAATTLARTDGEDQVAIRAGGRYGSRMHRAPDIAATPGWSAAGATVLITGGTGALGGHVARFLAGAGARRIILTSRRGADAPGAEEILAEVRALGAEAVAVACDTGDRAAVAAMLRDVQGDGVLIDAVIHAAGVGDGGPIEQAEVHQLARVSGGKVTGIINLEAELDPAQLKAVVYFSSGVAVWGAGDHGVYAGANAYLDARAVRRTAEGVPTWSIAWGPWAGAAGMVSVEVYDTLRRSGLPVMDPLATVRTLGRVLTGAGGALLVVEINWADFVSVFTSQRPSPLLADLTGALASPDAGPRTGSGLAERLAGLDPQARAAAVRDVVHQQVAAVLGHTGTDAVDPGRAFFEIGFDSLTAVELRDRLVAAIGVPLQSTLIFNHPSVDELTRHLDQEVLATQAAPAAPTVIRAAVADQSDPIVIVGMACRFPGGIDTPERMWQALVDGADMVAGLPEDRGWPLGKLYDPDPDTPHRTYVELGAFLYDAAEFDPRFFGISPREAVTMDPQHRVVLEASWEALERSGIDPRSLRGSRTGVYLGMTHQFYGERIRAGGPELEGYLVTGGAAAVGSGRVSYVLGLEGPAITVDTACSSSLVTLHMAAQALRAGECDLAINAGVAVMSDPTSFLTFSRQRGLARDGRCKPFAAAADGFGLGEGAGVVVLERLSDARANGHPVLATVLGSAVNQDGASNGLTAPSGPSQQRVIRAALANAGLDTADVELIEAHGTGTKLGDPIEAEAVLATYGQGRTEPAWMGSFKSNVGHTQAAAGVAGVIKSVLALRNQVMPKTLHVDEPTPHVDWAAGDVRLLTEARPWPRGSRPRRAAISAFGISGTNAHVVLEEVPADEPDDREAIPALPVPVVLSARTPEALRAQAGRLRELLAEPGAIPLDVGYSTVVTRSVFEHRAVVTGHDSAELVAELTRVAGRTGPVPPDATGRVAFLFTGQGAQRPGMGRALHQTFPTFAKAFDEVCAEMDGLLGRSLREVVFDDADAVHRTEYAQPALFAYEVALFALVRSWGLTPDVLAGHSIGELAAAYCAGLWSLPDACAVVAARGRLMQALRAPGAMAAIEATETEVRAALTADGDGVGIAAVNGPKAVVISGAEDRVLALAATFTAAGTRVKRLAVSHAFHSPLMDPMLDDFARVLAGITFAEPEIALVSGLTGQVAGAEVRTGDYWVRHVREAVRFADAVATLSEAGAGVFVEIGPDGVLTGMAATCLPDDTTAVLAATQHRDREETRTLVAGLGQLYARGVEVDWVSYFEGVGARRTALPTYPFQRESYWLHTEVPGVDDDQDDRGALYELRWIPAPEAPGATGLPAGDVLRIDLPAVAGEVGPATRTAVLDTLTRVRALLADEQQADKRILVRTERAVSIGDEPIDPVRAAARGLLLSAQLEHPGRLILVDTDDPGDVDPALLRADEPQQALRSGMLLLPRLTRIAAPAASRTPEPGPTGTVLVTGATGALGARLAVRLARTGRAARLLLVSRSGPDAPNARRLLAEIAATGVPAELVAADVADRSRVDELLAAVPAEQPLTAVIHVAGVNDDAAFTDLTAEQVTTVLRAKTDAALVLHEATAALDLTHFVLFSSAVGSLGGAGQANYAAANASLDALAVRRRAAGLPATSLGWGLWDTDDGMAGRLREVDKLRVARAGMLALTPDEGLDLFDLAWDNPGRDTAPVLLPLRMDPKTMADNAAAGTLAPVLRSLVPAPSVAARPTTPAVAADPAPGWAAMPGADRRRRLLELVRDQAGLILGLPPEAFLDNKKLFRDFGFDSLTGVELRNAVAAAVGVPLSAAMVFDHPTPDELVDHIEDQILRRAAPTALPVLAQLDQLEAAVAQLDPAAEIRREVESRLRDLVTAWSTPVAAVAAGVGPAGATVDDRLAEASDDDILDFIRNEFGKQ